MYDKDLGIKVVIKPLQSKTQCVEFTRPNSLDNPATTSQALIRERFIEVTAGDRFSITIAFKKEFNFHTAPIVKISRQVDDQRQVSTFHDKHRIKGQELTWDENSKYTFRKISTPAVDDPFEALGEYDKLVANTGSISVSIRPGNDDGIRFTSLQPAIRVIFRYASKDLLRVLGITYPPPKAAMNLDPRIRDRLELEEYRALRQAEENNKGLTLSQLLLNTSPPTPYTPRSATQPTTFGTASLANMPPAGLSNSSKASNAQPTGKQMGVRTPPAKRRKTSGQSDHEDPTVRLGSPFNMRARNLPDMVSKPMDHEPREFPRAPFAPILSTQIPTPDTTIPSSHLSEPRTIKCARTCGLRKPESEFLKDGVLLKSCAPCREMLRDNMRARRQKRATLKEEMATNNMNNKPSISPAGGTASVTVDAPEQRLTPDEQSQADGVHAESCEEAQASAGTKKCSSCRTVKPLCDFSRQKLTRSTQASRVFSLSSDWKVCNRCNTAQRKYEDQKRQVPRTVAEMRPEIGTTLPAAADNDHTDVSTKSVPPISGVATSMAPEVVPKERRQSTRPAQLPEQGPQYKSEPRKVVIDLTEDDIKSEVKTESATAKNIPESSPAGAELEVELSEDELEIRRLQKFREVATLDIAIIERQARMKKKQREKASL
ncbi:hypothetical protein FKW77_001779 [Venturia effusa]|uniref:DUF7918 domain-containing protein n=1 Tax=Venturia effusa TaxID=50376 RepID=A0A517LMB4_9PEZI|nr:hypothetical protein FKW77_001779 [Venturia effusa]